MKKLKSSNGFTLVELIVVIAMLAILSSVSIGGFEYSQKRAAIENDKALVKQLNQVLDSYSIFTHNEGAIHDALIEELGDTIEIQSLKFGYDVYYIESMYDFELRLKTGNEDKHNNLQYYLQLIKEDNFQINENYLMIKEEGINYSKIKKLTDDFYEYELEVFINPIFDENKTFFIDGSHTIILNNLIDTNNNPNNLQLSYEITTLSEVIYQKGNFSTPAITNGQITFSYPGNYSLRIAYNNISTMVKISVYNSHYHQLSKLSIEKIPTPAFKIIYSIQLMYFVLHRNNY